jgi:hypothetical protein
MSSDSDVTPLQDYGVIALVFGVPILAGYFLYKLAKWISGGRRWVGVGVGVILPIIFIAESLNV